MRRLILGSRVVAIVGPLVLGAAVPAQAQSRQPRQNVDVSTLGHQVGEPVQAVQASTPHLELQAYPSDARVGLGTRFAVAVDIVPRKGMHLYAPGASSYRVIRLRIDPQPHVRIAPVSYPASETFNFVPLNERVPVYTQPFTLAAEVTVGATAEGRKAFMGRKELVITGQLDYQACDDKICYNPVSLPMSWKVALTPNVPGAPQPSTR